MFDSESYALGAVAVALNIATEALIPAYNYACRLPGGPSHQVAKSIGEAQQSVRAARTELTKFI